MSRPKSKNVEARPRTDATTIESAYRTQLALGKIGIETKEPAPTLKRLAMIF